MGVLSKFRKKYISPVVSTVKAMAQTTKGQAIIAGGLSFLGVPPSTSFSAMRAFQTFQGGPPQVSYASPYARSEMAEPMYSPQGFYSPGPGYVPPRSLPDSPLNYQRAQPYPYQWQQQQMGFTPLRG